MKLFMKKILISILLFFTAMNVMAFPHYGPRYAPVYRSHYYHGNSGRFVTGMIVGSIIGGVIMQQQSQPIYIQPAPMYYPPNPPSYEYVDQYDPYCRCYVIVRRVVDPYNP